MKSMMWLLFTELKQSKFHFVLIFCISFLLGSSGDLTVRAEQKIAQLVTTDQWNSDIVVLPKGVTLQDLKAEIVSGHTTEFLPEAMFDSTYSMAGGQFQLTAILPLKDDSGPFLMTKGDPLDLVLKNMSSDLRSSAWHEQSTYSTSEWKNKLIAGFFAKGPPIAMRNLKELVDKRTVGQAIMIQKQNDHDKKVQSDLNGALFVYSGILLALVILSILSLIVWLKIKIANSMAVFNEIGLSRGKKNQYILGLVFLSVFIPVVMGIMTAQNIIIFYMGEGFR